MKVLIDIAEEEYLMIKTKIITGDDGYLDRAVADGIQIPDDATNGDVILNMFDTATVYGTDKENDCITICIDNNFYQKFSHSWWNSPYQKGEQ